MTGYLIVKNSSIGWIVSLDDDDDDDGYNDDEYNDDEYNDDEYNDDDCLWRWILSNIDSRRLVYSLYRCLTACWFSVS